MAKFIELENGTFINLDYITSTRNRGSSLVVNLVNGNEIEVYDENAGVFIKNILHNFSVASYTSQEE